MAGGGDFGLVDKGAGPARIVDDSQPFQFRQMGMHGFKLQIGRQSEFNTGNVAAPAYKPLRVGHQHVDNGHVGDCHH